MPMMDSQRVGAVLLVLDSFLGADMRLLILGGTSEARKLAERLSDDTRFELTMSLAGRTVLPAALPVHTRVGGFGGVRGLIEWLIEQRIEAVIDATHPFADQISAHVVAATKACNIPLGSLVRAPWVQRVGDEWVCVPSTQDAARALPITPCRVFLSVGRLGLSAFCERAEHSYVARTIDPPGDIPLPPDLTFLFERGPFDLANELALLKRYEINVLVSKNSGGAATYPKIEAARDLKIPVLMIARPLKPSGTILDNLEAALNWLEKKVS